MYLDAWRKQREGLPMEPVEAQVADIVALHPEYHAVIEGDEEVLHRDFSPESGQINPFLHMGLHLAIREQIGTDRPAGIRDVFVALARTRSEHDAEHAMLEALAEALWHSQRTGQPPDEQAYLERLQRLAR